MTQRYRRPPITEAVIEIRLDQPPVQREVLDKVHKRLLDAYPLSQQVQAVNVEIGDVAAKVQTGFLSYKMTAADGAGIVTLSSNLIATSRLSPYEGWEPFAAQAKANWEIWKRLVGFRKVVRVGVRYINRIDVPVGTDDTILIDDYLNFGPRLPSLGQPPMENFAISSAVPLGQHRLKLILNGSSTPSPLVKTLSFILDLDISRDEDLPQSDDTLWAFIEGIRAHKNRVFEACITERARRLFL